MIKIEDITTTPEQDSFIVQLRSHMRIIQAFLVAAVVCLIGAFISSTIGKGEPGGFIFFAAFFAFCALLVWAIVRFMAWSSVRFDVTHLYLSTTHSKLATGIAGRIPLEGTVKLRIEDYTEEIHDEDTTKQITLFKIYCGPSQAIQGIERRAHADRIVARIEQALRNMDVDIERWP